MDQDPLLSVEIEDSSKASVSPNLSLPHSTMSESSEVPPMSTSISKRSKAPSPESGSESSSGDTTTFNDEFDNSRHYVTLINRLREDLMRTTPPLADPKLLEIRCRCGSEYSDSSVLRCDVTTCSVGWYHTCCLPYKDQELANEFNLWICPGCFTHQLVDLINEQHRSKMVERSLWPRAADARDTVLRQQAQMARVDAQYRTDGRWIFANPFDEIVNRPATPQGP